MCFLHKPITEFFKLFCGHRSSSQPHNFLCSHLYVHHGLQRCAATSCSSWPHRLEVTEFRGQLRPIEIICLPQVHALYILNNFCSNACSTSGIPIILSVFLRLKFAMFRPARLSPQLPSANPVIYLLNSALYWLVYH